MAATALADNPADILKDGLRVVMSPFQMAAVFEEETLEAEGQLTTRLLGGLRILGCGAELLGAGALLAAPEPTLVTKAGGVALAAHGADQCTTGGREVWTGRAGRSLSERGVSSLARSLGAPQSIADGMGVATDFLVPISGAAFAGAVRVGAVRAGRIALMKHEAKAGTRIGGHTFERHVGWSDAMLHTRMADMAAKGRAPQSISTFSDLMTAERALTQALRIKKAAIVSWSRTAPKGRVFSFDTDLGKVIGRGVLRSDGSITPMTRIQVRLKKETYNGKLHYILTAFPIP